MWMFPLGFILFWMYRGYLYFRIINPLLLHSICLTYFLFVFNFVYGVCYCCQSAFRVLRFCLMVLQIFIPIFSSSTFVLFIHSFICMQVRTRVCICVHTYLYSCHSCKMILLSRWIFLFVYSIYSSFPNTRFITNMGNNVLKTLKFSINYKFTEFAV